MKKMIILLMSLAIVAGFSTISFAAISGSAHDFSSATWNSVGELCNVCHTPHNGGTEILWNHSSNTAQTYTLYSTQSGSTVGQPGANSRLCLSCHDGTIALDSFGGSSTSATFITGAALVGTDLSNDHPISVSIPVNSDYKTTATILSTLPLEGDTDVMCASCHDPHNGPNLTHLLRVDMGATSALCVTCHTK